MTIIVSVKINDGVVMAADSAGTMPSGQIYAHANKITNLYEGLPIGAMSTGAGGIGNESIETLLKDLRRRFAGLDPEHAHWRLDPSAYSLEEVAQRLQAFIFEEKVLPCGEDTTLQLRLCGYSAGRPLAEVWEVNVLRRASPAPRCIMGEDAFGVLWDGQYEALNRLVLGTGFEIGAALARHGVPADQVPRLQADLVGDLYATLSAPAMPIQDAIDLARFLVETTIGFVRFAVFLPKSVGGSVQIAAITKHEGFRWVQRPTLRGTELG
ncbi:hypothetical protein J8J14_24415 [Roseomonas sp. SSH11]|uniref:Proteasome subunit beta n=1 Tax=Pararoseomonas baculiformis TaxID=2820812 RepID=A0ABS4AMV0_9PROT|nr:hypothetical protein [Pararoseomonas baculiformis]MBP0447880.1 hypothetical protein [Pararoseomonas baculiformis]